MIDALPVPSKVAVTVKLRHMVADALGIDRQQVQIESTSTTRVANMSPTAASTAADLNGAAVRTACKTILARLRKVAAGVQEASPGQIAIAEERVWVDDRPGPLTWENLVQVAHAQRVDLSAHAFYATPTLHYDRQQEKGSPFAYHVCGTASIESVQIVHDAGRSLERWWTGARWKGR